LATAEIHIGIIRTNGGVLMGATTKLTFKEFRELPGEPGKSFELDRGELIVEPSPTYRHNRIRYRIARHLDDFVQQHQLGGVTVENDFRLAPDIVRNPDVAFVRAERLSEMDVDRSPIESVPNLAIEVISPTNSAEDMLTKVHQYLDAGCQAVWVFYPSLRVVEVHDSHGTREVAMPASLREEKLFGDASYSLPLSLIFDEDIRK
jgi:Uma2 family endonuclease